MSSTLRGAIRAEADFYATPAWCTRRFLEAVPLPGGHWLEPGAGEGDIIRAANSVRPGLNWTALELRHSCSPILNRTLGPGANPVWYGDFLSLDFRYPVPRWDVVIANPPFRIAIEFVQQALRCAPVVAMLLRLNFLGSGSRAKFFHRHPPDVYVLPNRPSFTGHGTDSIEYAWFVWWRDREQQRGELGVLGLTSTKEVRQDRQEREELWNSTP